MGIFIRAANELLNASPFRAKYFTKFGYIQDNEDKRDLLFSNVGIDVFGSKMVNENISLKKYFKDIESQYQLGSCVACATTSAFEAMIAKRKDISPTNVDDLSRLFVYWVSRNNEDPPSANKDDGTRIRLAFDSLCRYGCPSEKCYPYDVNKVNDRPTIIAFRTAIQHRIDKFYRIDGTGNERINQIKQALYNETPIVFGTKLAVPYRDVKDETVVQLPTGNWLGNHAQVITGWREDLQAFEIRNSWGLDFGFEGYCYMSVDYIKADITRDLWVATV